MRAPSALQSLCSLCRYRSSLEAASPRSSRSARAVASLHRPGRYHNLLLTMSYLPSSSSPFLLSPPPPVSPSSGPLSKAATSRSSASSAGETPILGRERDARASSARREDEVRSRCEAKERREMPIRSLRATRLDPGRGRQFLQREGDRAETMKETHHIHPTPTTSATTTPLPTLAHVSSSSPRPTPLGPDPPHCALLGGTAHSSTPLSSASISNAWLMTRTTRHPSGRAAKPRRRETSGDWSTKGWWGVRARARGGREGGGEDTLVSEGAWRGEGERERETHLALVRAPPAPSGSARHQVLAQDVDEPAIDARADVVELGDEGVFEPVDGALGAEDDDGGGEGLVQEGQERGEGERRRRGEVGREGEGERGERRARDEVAERDDEEHEAQLEPLDDVCSRGMLASSANP